MNIPVYLLAAQQTQIGYIWRSATPEGKIIIICLVFFSICAWTVMVSKALQMRRARQFNEYFDAEYRSQKNVMGIYDRRLQVEGCPLFTVYQSGCLELEHRLRTGEGEERKKHLTLKSVEHIKRTLEGAVSREALKLESGLIMLAIAVSGAPFLGLLGKADSQTMAPGVSSSLSTTVAGLLVAIPSMFAYNWLVHTLRVRTVELDNFAQDLMSRIETEYLKDE